MTPGYLLADLTRHGFRLVVSGNDIRVAPAGKLTDSQRQVIRENKGELLALIRAGVPPAARRRARKPQRKPPGATPAPMPPRTEPPDPMPPKRPLCSRCRPLGFANCRDCVLASEPGLVLGSDGVIYRTRLPVEPIVRGWHRCEECNEPYYGVRPPFGTRKLCPKCLPGPSPLCPKCKNREVAKDRDS
jgi:hypothetical protein